MIIDSTNVHITKQDNVLSCVRSEDQDKPVKIISLTHPSFALARLH